VVYYRVLPRNYRVLLRNILTAKCVHSNSMQRVSTIAAIRSNPMKRILLPAALAFALCGSFAVAQQPDQQQAPAPVERHHHHAPDPQKAAAMLSKKLNLTPDQTAKLEPILADRDQKMSALMANTALAPQDRRQQFMAIHQATEQQLAGVLTPDQLQQMKAMRHGRRGHHGDPNQAPAA
jgi:protein CpxP